MKLPVSLILLTSLALGACHKVQEENHRSRASMPEDGIGNVLSKKEISAKWQEVAELAQPQTALETHPIIPDDRGTKEDVDLEFDWTLMKSTGAAVAAISDAIAEVYANNEILKPTTTAAECSSIFSAYDSIFVGIESDAHRISETLSDMQNLFQLDPQARIMQDGDAEKDLWAVSTSFETLADDQETVVGKGFIRSKGEGEKILARFGRSLSDDGYESSFFEWATADLAQKTITIRVAARLKEPFIKAVTADVIATFHLGNGSFELHESMSDGETSFATTFSFAFKNANTLIYQLTSGEQKHSREISREAAGGICTISAL